MKGLYVLALISTIFLLAIICLTIILTVNVSRVLKNQYELDAKTRATSFNAGWEKGLAAGIRHGPKKPLNNVIPFNRR